MAERLRFALLGRPVRRSFSPAIHAAAYKALGLPHVYTAMDVPTADALRRALGDVRTGILHGVNVTLPFKRAVLEMVDEVGPTAAEVGAANVIVGRDGRLIAHNTDAAALAEDIAEAWGGRPKGRGVVIGAGGAGLAAIVALKALGFAVIGVTTRSWTSSELVFEAESADRARALGALTTLWPESSEGSSTSAASQVLRMQWRELAVQADCIVQATSAGLLGAAGEDILGIVPWERVPPHAFVYDVIYNPAVTPFLRSARANGLRAHGGLGMLVRQAARSIKIWTGLEPPLGPMFKAAEEAQGSA